MRLKEFKLERYFAQHEFTAKHLLSSSDCDGFSLQEILSTATDEELTMWEKLEFGYTESSGHPLLKHSILQHYSTNNPDNVVVASPGELNFITMNILLNPNDHVVIISPAYQSLYEIVKSIGCQISHWKPNKEEWKFDIDDLKQLINDKTKLIILNFPHNPTGSYLDLAELKEIVAITRNHGIHILSDEMYHKLVGQNTPELPPVADIYEKGISLWGTSKSFGLAGLRMGWVVSQDLDYVRQLLSFKDYLSICSSAPSEILAMIALNHSSHFIDQNVEKINRNINCFQEFANQNEVIQKFVPPRAGSASFVQLNIDETSQEFSDNLVLNTGIMTLPGEMFDYYGKYIRIGFGRKNFPKVLSLFQEYLNDNYNK